MSSPTEELVEDVAVVYLGAIGASTKRAVVIVDAGARGGATEVALKGRLGAAMHRLNPDRRTTRSRRWCGSYGARRIRR